MSDSASVEWPKQSSKPEVKGASRDRVLKSCGSGWMHNMTNTIVAASWSQLTVKQTSFCGYAGRKKRRQTERGTELSGTVESVSTRRRFYLKQQQAQNEVELNGEHCYGGVVVEMMFG